MINDYHAMRVGLSIRTMPDDMVHDLGRQVELKALEAGIKVQELAMFYESLRRREPRVHGVTVSDSVNLKEQLG